MRDMTNEPFKALLNAAVDGIIVIDADGTVLQLNHAAWDMFGYQEHEVVGNNVSMLMPTEHSHKHDGYLAHYHRTNEARIIGIGREVEGLRKDGAVFPLDLSVGEVEQVDSDGPRFVGILRDITARKELEEMLAHERHMAESYLDSMQVLILVLDRDHCVSVSNRRASKQLGLVLKEGVSFLTDLVVPGEAHDLTDLLDEVYAGTRGEVATNLWCFDSTGGRRLISWRFTVLDTEPASMLCSGLDITDQHRDQEAREALESSIAHMDRLAMLGEMAAGIAHEINQPLAAISNFADAAGRFLGGPQVNLDSARLAATRISEQARRAADVVTKVRGLARADTVQGTKQNVNDLLTDLAALAELDARKSKVPIKLNLQENLPLCELDPVQIQQVVLNLTRNAIEALTSHRQALAGVEISSRYSADENCIWVSVRDHGPGVDASIADELFEPFQTTKASGLGLGLSICASIVRKHGGTLSYEEAPGGGALFQFSLPCADE